MDRKNPLAAELEAIDKLLDEMPEILELVHADINRSEAPSGRPGEASAEQILRSAIPETTKDCFLRGSSHRHIRLRTDRGSDRSPLLQW